MSGLAVSYGDSLLLYCTSSDGSVAGYVSFTNKNPSGQGQFFTICPNCPYQPVIGKGTPFTQAPFVPLPAKTSQVTQPPFTSSNPFAGQEGVNMNVNDIFYLGGISLLYNPPGNWPSSLIFASSTDEYSELHATDIQNYPENGQIQALNVQNPGPNNTFIYGQTTFQLALEQNSNTSINGTFYGNTNNTFQGYASIVPSKQWNVGYYLLTFTFFPPVISKGGPVGTGKKSTSQGLGAILPFYKKRQVSNSDPPASLNADPPTTTTSSGKLGDPVSITTIAFIGLLVLILIGSIIPIPFLSCKKNKKY